MKNICLILSLCLLLGCSTTSEVANSNQKLLNSHNFQAGGSWGGIIEDTKIDAVSGATKSSVNIGFHPTLNIHGHLIETGIDFLHYNQTFTYFDNTNNYDGKREFNYSEIRLPITYNFQFLKNTNNEGQLIIKLGMSLGYRISENIKNSGEVPDYTFDKFSIGPTLGLSTIPFKLNDKYRLGIYVDFVRASKIYKDYYTVADDLGNMSNLKFGIVLNIK